MSCSHPSLHQSDNCKSNVAIVYIACSEGEREGEKMGGRKRERGRERLRRREIEKTTRSMVWLTRVMKMEGCGDGCSDDGALIVCFHLKELVGRHSPPGEREKHLVQSD